MASERKLVDFIIDQIGFIEQVTDRKMFGEYGHYFDLKYLALFATINYLLSRPNLEENISIMLLKHRHIQVQNQVF